MKSTSIKLSLFFFCYTFLFFHPAHCQTITFKSEIKRIQRVEGLVDDESNFAFYLQTVQDDYMHFYDSSGNEISHLKVPSMDFFGTQNNEKEFIVYGRENRERKELKAIVLPKTSAGKPVIHSFSKEDSEGFISAFIYNNLFHLITASRDGNQIILKKYTHPNNATETKYAIDNNLAKAIKKEKASFINYNKKYIPDDIKSKTKVFVRPGQFVITLDSDSNLESELQVIEFTEDTQKAVAMTFSLPFIKYSAHNSFLIEDKIFVLNVHDYFQLLILDAKNGKEIKSFKYGNKDVLDLKKSYFIVGSNPDDSTEHSDNDAGKINRKLRGGTPYVGLERHDSNTLRIILGAEKWLGDGQNGYLEQFSFYGFLDLSWNIVDGQFEESVYTRAKKATGLDHNRFTGVTKIAGEKVDASSMFESDKAIYFVYKTTNDRNLKLRKLSNK